MNTFSRSSHLKVLDMVQKILAVIFCTSLLATFAEAAIGPNFLRFFYNPTYPLISVVNDTNGTAAVWDPSSSLVATFDGNNGSAIIYNFRNNSGIYIPGKFLSSSWNNSLEDFPNFILNVSLHELFNQTAINGTPFTIFNISKQISEEIARYISTWSPQYSQNPGNNSLQLLANISANLTELYNGTITGLFPLIARRVIFITDLLRFFEFLRGISIFFNSIRGGIETLQSRGFAFDPYPILYARNGVEALVALLRALQYSFDLNQLLNTNLNAAETFYQLVTQLGGNGCTGVTGSFRRMYEQMTMTNPICENPAEIFMQNWESSMVNEWMQSINSLFAMTQNLNSQFEGLRNLARGLRSQSAIYPYQVTNM